MSAPLLVRIDDRLLHGQVLVAWAAALRPCRFVLASDAVAADPERRAVYELLASTADAEVSIVDIPAAVGLVNGGEAARTLFVCESPAGVRRLVERGGEVPAVNVGGLHRGAETRMLLPFVHLTAADCDDLGALLQRGVRLEARDLPSSRAVVLDAAALAALWA